MSEELDTNSARPPMPPKVAAAISAVMGEVPRLEKSETNSHGRYNFASIDDFLEAVRPLCAANGLIILQDEESFDIRETEATDDRGNVKKSAWLMMRFRFTLAHSSGETWGHRPVRTAMVNAAMGAQAFGAAQSYALKQFERSLFQIATGEKDADADSHPQSNLPKTKGSRTNGKPASNGQPVDAGMTPTALKAGMKKFVLTELPAVKTLAELKALEAKHRDMLDQCISQLPAWWFGDDNQPGAKKRIDERRKALLTFTVTMPDGSEVECDADNLSKTLDTALKAAATPQSIAGIWESSNMSEALQTLAEIGRDDVIEAINLTKQGHQARFAESPEEVFPDAAE